MSRKNEIPKKHQLKCEGCSQILDMRDPSIIGHGWIENGVIVCYDLEGLKYSSSKRVGDSIEWTEGKKPVHLN